MIGINSFILGAPSINPWFDPGKEADVAKALFAQGVDILAQHTDSTAPLQVAEERHLLGFGQSSDMIKFAPHAQLTANTDNWDPYYVERVKAALDGTWKPDNVWLSIKDDAVKLSPFTNVLGDVKAMSEATKRSPTAGTHSPARSPSRTAARWLTDGQAADDGALLGMNVYVKGIDDKLPQ